MIPMHNRRASFIADGLPLVDKRWMVSDRRHCKLAQANTLGPKHKFDPTSARTYPLLAPARHRPHFHHLHGPRHSSDSSWAAPQTLKPAKHALHRKKRGVMPSGRTFYGVKLVGAVPLSTPGQEGSCGDAEAEASQDSYCLHSTEGCVSTDTAWATGRSRTLSVDTAMRRQHSEEESAGRAALAHMETNTSPTQGAASWKAAKKRKSRARRQERQRSHSVEVMSPSTAEMWRTLESALAQAEELLPPAALDDVPGGMESPTEPT